MFGKCPLYTAQKYLSSVGCVPSNYKALDKSGAEAPPKKSLYFKTNMRFAGVDYSNDTKKPK